jgi:hypothetical protein
VDAVDPLDWLLDSDPAIRWQALRDLTDAPPKALAAERARVPREGVGAQVLASQGADGSWHKKGSPDWLPTLFTMQLLRATGVDRTDPAVVSAVARLEAGFRWDEEFGKKPFFEGEVEPCINGGALALGAYFGRWLLERSYDESLAFPFGEAVGQPSRWNTLRALRALRWSAPPDHLICGRSLGEATLRVRRLIARSNPPWRLTGTAPSAEDECRS